MREPRLSEVAAFKRAELARWREADCADLMAAARKEVVEEYENVMPEILMAAREEGRREEWERLFAKAEKHRAMFNANEWGAVMFVLFIKLGQATSKDLAEAASRFAARFPATPEPSE